MKKKLNKIIRIYLFCEWDTEKWYFNKIIKLNRNHWVKFKFIDLWWWTKIKNNPEWIIWSINKTIKQNKNKKYDDQKIYLLFDLDIFDKKSQLDKVLLILKEKYLKRKRTWGRTK